jgi:predicted nucleic acid-binding Zn ribbon protein
VILRNNAHPRGIDLGPVRLWTPNLKPIAGGLGTRQGQSYREVASLIAAANRRRRAARAERAARPKPEVVLLHVQCPGPCKSVFETYNPRRVWCSQSCLEKYRRKQRRTSAPRVVRASSRGTLVSIGDCCPVCGKDFERRSNRQRYCSKACKMEAASRLAEPATCHPDRPMLAKGRCRSCYNRSWKANRKTPS